MKNEPFDTIVNRRLSGMQFEGADQVIAALQKQDTPRMPATHRRFRLAIVLAILLTLLIGTALALGLRYTAGYSARKAADAALVKTYGFEQETIGLFWVREKPQENGILFTYTPHMTPQKSGEYQVLLGKDGKAAATWSLDGQDPKQYESGSLEDPIWGAKQMNTYLKLKNAYYGKAAQFDWENVSRWTLAQRAEVFGLLQQMQLAYGETSSYKDIVPDGDDIQPEEAIPLVKEHLKKTTACQTAILTPLHPAWCSRKAWRITSGAITSSSATRQHAITTICPARKCSPPPFSRLKEHLKRPAGICPTQKSAACRRGI